MKESLEKFNQKDKVFRRRLVKGGIITIGLLGSGAGIGLLEEIFFKQDLQQQALTVLSKKKDHVQNTIVNPESIEEFVSLSEIVTKPQKYWNKETPLFLDIYKDTDANMQFNDTALLNKSVIPFKNGKTGEINKNPVYNGLLVSSKTNKEILWFSEDQHSLAAIQLVGKKIHILENIRGKLVQMNHIPVQTKLATEPTFTQGWALQITNVLTKTRPARKNASH